MDKREAKKVLKQFQCDKVREAEEAFAQTFSENPEARVFFVNESNVYTDGKNIVLDPAGRDVYRAENSLKKAAEKMGLDPKRFEDIWMSLAWLTRAQNIHECLHILFSEFPFTVRSKDINTLIKKKTAKEIYNIIEDAYIEAAAATLYDNAAAYLRFSKYAQYYALNEPDGDKNEKTEHSDIPENIDKEQLERLMMLKYYLNLMCSLILYPFGEPEKIPERLRPYVLSTYKLFLSGASAPAPKERREYVLKIFDIIRPLIPDIPDGKAEAAALYLSLNISGHKTHEGESGAPKPGREQKITTLLFTDLNGQLIDLTSEELAEKIKETAEIIFIEILKVKADAQAEAEFGEDVRVKVISASDLGCSPMHRNIKIEEIRLKPDLNYKKAYNNIADRFRSDIRTYSARFEQIIKAKTDVREEKQLFGSGITSSRLYDPRKRYWYKKTPGIDAPDLAVMLLIDGSGSMSGMRNLNVKYASVILHEVLKRVNIPHVIVTHNAEFVDPVVYAHILKGFNAPDKSKYNILRSPAKGDNRDGAALYWAEKYLNAHSDADNKLLLVLSDGLPEHSYDNYYAPASVKDTANAVKKISRRGISVVGIALDDEGGYLTERLKEIFPHLVSVTDLKRLAPSLISVVSKALRG